MVFLKKTKYASNDRVDIVLSCPKGGITVQIQTLRGIHRWYVDPYRETLQGLKKQLRACLQDLNEKRTFLDTARVFFCEQEVLEAGESKTLSELGIVAEGSRLLVVGSRTADVVDSSLVEKGCTIPQAELRGITLRQLQEVVIHIFNRCEPEGWTSTLDGHLLKPEEVNLYDLNHHHIKPSTSERKCSYVEAVASGPQNHMYLVSHWWGEPVVEFVNCLTQHAFDRNLPDTTSYWVCAYAINQHQLGSELADPNPKHSPFFKAMQSAVGTVSVLDRRGITYKRIWCSFELYLALVELASSRSNQANKRYLYDVYTAARVDALERNFPVGITDGLAASDKWITNRSTGLLDFSVETGSAESKSSRERSFPSIMMDQALSIQLETAYATEETDKIRILNYIIGETDLDKVPTPTTHEKFNEVNALLRGKFAVSGYARAVDAGEDMTEYRQILSKSPMRHLEISFHNNISNFWNEVKYFLHCLPLTLEEVALVFSWQSLRESSNPSSYLDIFVGLGRLLNLRSLALEYNNMNLTSCFIPSFVNEMTKLRNLESLHLNFSANDILSINGLEEAIETQRQSLCNLHLEFDANQQLTSIQSLVSGGIQKLQCLRDLSLAFNLCPLESLGGLGAVLAQSTFHLEKLKLDFVDCREVSNDCFLSLFDALEHRQSKTLKSLSLRFRKNGHLSSLDGLASAIACMAHLEKLVLAFNCCNQIGALHFWRIAKALVDHTREDMELCLVFGRSPIRRRSWLYDANTLGKLRSALARTDAFAKAEQLWE
ncbi:expressed unknown protein [Seminavis robusta]|uniref:Uncharacterized protein n=1 Tax=Seminavis robusta TaxID=568900 RepID=A0A9N8EFK9_9STRA|nr:expressed unknown protein [Seminavis robusta]|eukprot:Sro1051_g235680.1 n/a (775) ;mRNA; f:14570-16894